MNTATAVILEKPEQLKLGRLDLTDPVAGDVVVDIEWSGISTGTERLLWTGKMPSFPGMGYPLVPGYESVGKIVALGPQTQIATSAKQFISPARVATAKCEGLFGGACVFQGRGAERQCRDQGRCRSGRRRCADGVGRDRVPCACDRRCQAAGPDHRARRARALVGADRCRAWAGRRPFGKPTPGAA